MCATFSQQLARLPRRILIGTFIATAMLVCGRSTALVAKPVDFAHDIMPVLVARCGQCHIGGKHEGDLSLETREAIVAADVVSVGDSAKSELFNRLTTTDPDLRMPAKGDPLKPEEIAAMRDWIDQGLDWPAEITLKPERYRPHLAPRRPEIPTLGGDATNPLDHFLAAYQARVGQPALPTADDATFLRRAQLDLVGLLPTVEEVQQFVADPNPQKRESLVQKLLGNDEAYTLHWITFWNDLLRNDPEGPGYIDGGRKQITNWLFAALKSNMPFDQFVRGLISPTEESEGFIKGVIWRGNVNASQRREMQFSQNVSQVFLGVNMKCASCHDSFIDDWKLVDAYGLAAVVSDEPLEIHRCDVPQGKLAEAKFPFPELGNIDPGAPKAERLKACAELLTSPNNGRFARTIVNRLWQRLMGRGLVHPVDVMNNRPWDEDTLDFLATYLVDEHYNLKKVLVLIATSRAYGAQSVSLAEDALPEDYVFQGPLVKRMTAEEFLDAVWQITGSAQGESVKDAPKYAGAIRASLAKSNQLMRVLGRPIREQVVSTRPDKLTTLEALALSNGTVFSDLMKQGAKNLRQRFGDPEPEPLVEWLYLASLGRRPTADELVVATEIVGSPTTDERVEDLLWSVLMLPQFQLIY